VRHLPAAAAALGLALLLFGYSEAQPLAPALVTRPCTEGRSKVAAICGTFRVYENRNSRAGRTIELGFVLLKAEHPSGRVIYLNPGGPGGLTAIYAGAIADGQFLRPLWVLRSRYDILLLDNRGMGESAPLDCNGIYDPAHPNAYFMQLWPSAALRACRAREARTHDLSDYTTDNAVDDLNDLRAALGYRKIVLLGGSYGTYFSLVYMRRHPRTVESAVLDGVAPPHLLTVPLEDAYGAQLAMDDVIRECADDAACHHRFPHLRAHFAAVLRRFDGGPIAIAVRNPVTHRLQRVRLSRQVFDDRLRQLLYDESDAAYVPLIIDDAYRGNYRPLGAMVSAVTLSFVQILDTGANLSYACAEQLPFITSATIEHTSANSFQGDTRVRAELEACRIWNVRPVPASENRIVRSRLPVLMVSGTNDPTSPAIYAQEELPYLPNARLILQRGEGHGATTPCTDRLIVQFVLDGSARNLPTSSCAGSFHRPPFVLNLSSSQMSQM
jgi:pimeloyl-ACP methyl ester carboxylesterase